MYGDNINVWIQLLRRKINR